MKIQTDKNGAAGGKMMLVMFAILMVIVLFLSGIISFQVPTATDRFTEKVARGPTDVGMIVPITVKLTFDQDASATDKQAVVNIDTKHSHESLGSDDNYVPDPVVVTTTSFDTKVGNVNDNNTIYAVNNQAFKSSNKAFDASVYSAAGVNYGNSQDNYKVWMSTGTQYTPALTKDNSGVLISTVWKHYRKATSELLSADTVNFLLYVKQPDYNVDDAYSESFTFKVFVPFNDYAVVEDIIVDIRGYWERCTIEWTTVETVTHTYWDFPLLNELLPDPVGDIKLVKSRDTTLATAIAYSWLGPTDLSIDNSDTWGSHTYTYQIR